MLDRTVPYYKVLMEKTDPSQFPRYDLPPGYEFCFFRPELRDDWVRIQCSSQHCETQAEAEAAFERAFAPHWEALAHRCLFVLDPDGTPVATACIWPGYHFGYERQRLHWVAVAQGQKGKGLAKAMVSRLLELYPQIDDKNYFYLTTQSWSWPAVGLYLAFGFKPYMGPMPANWPSPHYDIENELAWQLIEQKLAEAKRT